MEIPKPDTENVVYLDEYPHLTEKARLRRFFDSRNMGRTGLAAVFQFPVDYREIMEEPPYGS